MSEDIGQRVVAALSEPAARELLEVLERSDADRAALIGRLHVRDDAAWLAELLMYLSWASGGGAGLIALKTSLAICVLALAHASMARVPISLPIRILLLFPAAAGIWARIYVVRPQIFSIVLFAALLLVFRRVEHGGRRALWILPAIFACWVNLHGGWVVGLCAVAVWTALNLTPLRSAIVAPGHALVVLALCTLATVLNPYSLGMWSFLAETMRLDRRRGRHHP